MDQVQTFSRALCLCQWQLHQRPEHPGEGPQEDRHHRQLPTGDPVTTATRLAQTNPIHPTLS